MNVFYVSTRTTENYEFDKIRTTGVTGKATNYKNSQGDNPMCSTRDEISRPPRPISPRAATAYTPHVTVGHTRTRVTHNIIEIIYGFYPV